MYTISVVGSRTFKDYTLLKRTLNEIRERSHERSVVLVSGGARGADQLAERYAREYSLPIRILSPDWNRYGKSAGLRRNTDIVQECDILVAFWDQKSNGTRDSINKARRMKKDLKIILF